MDKGRRAGPRFRRIFQVDVFTRRPFKGNPAGVVPDASGLSEADMRAIAREMNNSETAFLLPSDGADHDVQARFFTPSTEIPVCGHASLAAQLVRGALRGQRSGVVRQRSRGGLWRIGWRLEGPHCGRAWMVQSPLELGRPLGEVFRRRTLRAFRVTESAIPSSLPLRVGSAGHPKLLVPFSSVEGLLKLVPDAAALGALSARAGVNGLFAFALDDRRPSRVVARMFAPAIGIPEDPFNGSGQGPLGAYLVAHRLIRVRGGQGQFSCRMGDSMGRPGTARVRLSVGDSGARHARVEGHAVIVFCAELRV